MQNFTFENWDFLDPRIIAKFHKISEVSQMLIEQQNKLKNVDFLSFKDRNIVQNNINKFKDNLSSMLESQKENLIDYFDNQVNVLSKRSHPKCHSQTYRESMKFQNTFRSTFSSQKVPSKGRRYSEGDLSRYLKDKEIKERVLNELPRPSYDSNAHVMDTSRMIQHTPRNKLSSDEKRGSLLQLNELNSTRSVHTAKKKNYFKDIREVGSFLSHEMPSCETQAESQFLKSKMLSLGRELDKAKTELRFLRNFYQTHQKRRRILKESKRLQVPTRKDFVRDSRNRRKEVKTKNNDHEYTTLEEENNQLKAEIERLNQRLNQKIDDEQKLKEEFIEINNYLTQNEEFLDMMKKSKKEIEKEMCLTKELNIILLDNFSQFKSYVEKAFTEVSKKLAVYVEKEEYYQDLVKENEHLKYKCKALLLKFKEMAES